MEAVLANSRLALIGILEEEEGGHKRKPPAGIPDGAEDGEGEELIPAN